MLITKLSDIQRLSAKCKAVLSPLHHWRVTKLPLITGIQGKRSGSRFVEAKMAGAQPIGGAALTAVGGIVWRSWAVQALDWSA